VERPDLLDRSIIFNLSERAIAKMINFGIA
jgi:hypothetical protein